jgi:ankyrin repeat protein
MRVIATHGSLLLAFLAVTTVTTAGDSALAWEPAEIQAFLEAARRGELDTVRERLDAGMPVDVTLEPRDPRYPYTVRTALESASLYARMDVVRLLLARGAALRRDERYGVYAAGMHSSESTELLAVLVAAAGPDADLEADFGPALVRAAANGARSEVVYLLGLGIDPDFRSRHEPWDDPAIVRAGAHLEIVDLLLEAGADPTGGGPGSRWTALFPAAGAADAERTRRYLALGIDPHVEGPRGNALSLAACRFARTAAPSAEQQASSRQVVALLLAEQVDPNVPADGRTPLRCAEDARDAELAAVLEAAGGRSRESLWNVVSRGVRRAALVAALMLGGGM